MKKLFVILTLLLTAKVFGQTEEIYRLTFSDKSNFKLTTLLDHKLPKTFFIIDTTDAWNSNRFWLTDFDNKEKEQVIESIQNDEHHSYFRSYLFSDTFLNKLFSDKEKQQLCDKSKTLKSKPIHLNGSNYKTITSSKNIKGFYFVTSEPIISDDKKFAFIDLTVFYKETYKQSLNETYFGTIGIVFQRQGKSWKRIVKKDWLIL
jgi:hypothetical protein